MRLVVEHVEGAVVGTLTVAGGQPQVTGAAGFLLGMESDGLSWRADWPRFAEALHDWTNGYLHVRREDVPDEPTGTVASSPRPGEEDMTEITAPDPTTTSALPTGWRGVLAPLDVQSGDGRILGTPPDLRLRTPPMSLLYQRQLDMDPHGGAVVAGRIDRAWIENGQLMGEGPFDLGSDDGREAARQLGEGYCNGVSVDLDDMTVEERWFDADGNPIDTEGMDWDELEELWEDGAQSVVVVTDWRLMTATMVSQPAFDEARLTALFDYVSPADDDKDDDEEGEGEEVEVVTASVTGDTGLPIGDRDASWDAAAAVDRIFEQFTDADGNVDAAAVATAHLWQDPDADDQTKAAYSLPFADVVDGTLTIIPNGVAATAGGRGVDATKGIGDDDKATIKNKICTLYGKIRDTYDDWPDCPFDEAEPAEEESQSAAGALVAAGAAPDAACFANPELGRPTPLTVTDDGRVYGHLATWGTCHTGWSDTCVTPPKSGSGYAYFHVGEIATSGGAVPVGRITLGTGHAEPRAGYRAALEHYDNTGSCVAAVRAGEDAHGIWVAGVLVGDVTDEQIADLRRSPLSGDWRRIGGQLELVAALAVNVPGFPVPRALAASAARRQMSLVAAGAVPVRRRRRPAEAAQPIDYKRLARQVVVEQRGYTARDRRAAALARRIGRDPRSRLAAVDQRMGRGS